MNRKKVLMLSFMLIMAMLLLSGCVPGDGSKTPDDPAGFFSGVWHGWIAPFSLIYSLFNSRIGIYEVYNTGFWYNLGYYRGRLRHGCCQCGEVHALRPRRSAGRQRQPWPRSWFRSPPSG